jgi:hypothetical protein
VRGPPVPRLPACPRVSLGAEVVPCFTLHFFLFKRPGAGSAAALRAAPCRWPGPAFAGGFGGQAREGIPVKWRASRLAWCHSLGTSGVTAAGVAVAKSANLARRLCCCAIRLRRGYGGTGPRSRGRFGGRERLSPTRARLARTRRSPSESVRLRQGSGWAGPPPPRLRRDGSGRTSWRRTSWTRRRLALTSPRARNRGCRVPARLPEASGTIRAATLNAGPDRVP